MLFGLQGWAERPIFGKIRYMNYEVIAVINFVTDEVVINRSYFDSWQGCKRKFDVKKFVAKYPPASRNAAAAVGQRTIAY